jgi:hypothetical protein
MHNLQVTSKDEVLVDTGESVDEAGSSSQLFRYMELYWNSSFDPENVHLTLKDVLHSNNRVYNNCQKFQEVEMSIPVQEVLDSNYNWEHHFLFEKVVVYHTFQKMLPEFKKSLKHVFEIHF